MTGNVPHAGAEDLSALARGKLTRILGPVRGERLFAQVLAELHLPGLATPEELHAFGERLSRMGGMEAAVGGLLTVAATLRGARGKA
jgi:hypothetical protein